jgi:hypothetical protein
MQIQATPRFLQSGWPSPRKQQKMLLIGHGEPSDSIGGNVTSAATMEISIEVPQKTKNRLTL